MRLPLALVATTLLAATAAAAQQLARSPASTAVPADEQSCENLAETSSMIPRREECHIRVEQERIAADSRADAPTDVVRRTGASPSAS